MVFGEFAAGKYLRLACTAVLPTWVLIWLYVAFISSSADSISLRPCSVHAAASFGSHRRELHRCGTVHVLHSWLQLAKKGPQLQWVHRVPACRTC